MLTDSVPKLRGPDPRQSRGTLGDLSEKPNAHPAHPVMLAWPLAAKLPRFSLSADSENIIAENSKSLVLIRESEKP